jgi:translocation and assembly module TamB
MVKMKKIAMSLAAILAVIAGGAFWVLGKSDLAADLVAQKAREVARERFAAELSLEGVSGNPLAGFHFGRISLAYRDKPVLSALDLSISFKLLSLFGSNPEVRSLSLSGLEMDLDRATDFMKQFEGGGASKLEVSRLVVNQGLLRTGFGEVRVPRLEASVSGSRYEADFEAETRGVPFSGKVRLEHEGTRTVLENLEMAIRKGKGSFTGAVRPGLDLKGSVEGLDISDAPVFWPGAGKPGELKGTLSGPVNLSGTWEAPRIQGKMKLSAGQLYGFSVDAAEASVAFASGILKLEGLSGKTGEGTFSGAAEVALAKGPAAIKGNLAAGNLPIETFQARFPELEGVKGKINVPRMSFSGNVRSIRLQGRVESPSIEFGGDVLEKAAADVTLAENRVLSLKGSGTWMGGPVGFDGTVDLKNAPVLALAFRASSVSLEKMSSRFSGLKTLEGKGALRAELNLSGSPKAPKVSGRAASDRLVARGETLDAASASFSLAGETVTVTSLAARWQQAAVSGSGTIGKIRSENPVFDFSGTARGLEAGAFAARMKDLEAMQLSGTGTADWKVSGTAKDLSFSVAFSSSRLETPDFRVAGVKADVNGRIQEKVEAGPMEIRFSSEAAVLGKARAEAIAGTLTRTKEAFEVPAFSARLAGGSVKGSGRLVPGKEKEPARLDFKASAAGVGLQTLSGWAGLKDPAEGKADLSVTLGGTTKDPLLGIEASIPVLQVSGLRLSDVRLKGSGKPSDMAFDPVTASAGDGRITATGRLLSKEGAPLSVEFNAKGTDLDLKTLASGMQAGGESPPTGKIDLSMKGRFSGGSVEGSGELASRGTIRFMGTTLADLKTPLVLEKGRLAASNVTGSAYGGRIEGNLGLGDGRKWTARFRLAGADLDAYLKDQMKLEGRVTGRFDLDFQGSGTLGADNSVEGSGTFGANNGEVSGFRYVKAISTLYGRSSIRYRVLDAPYRLQGDRLILEGGRAEAIAGDPLYEYMEFDGTVGPKKALALNVRGRVNVQAVNALVGGVRGGVLQAGKSVQEILQGFLQGASGAMSTRDIRMVRGRVVGTTDNPNLTDLRIEGAAQNQAAPTGEEVPEEAPSTPQQPNLQDQIQQEILKRIFNP